MQVGLSPASFNTSAARSAELQYRWHAQMLTHVWDNLGYKRRRIVLTRFSKHSIVATPHSCRLETKRFGIERVEQMYLTGTGKSDFR